MKHSDYSSNKNGNLLDSEISILLFTTWLALCLKLNTLDLLQYRLGVGLISDSASLDRMSPEALITACGSV